MAKRKPKLVEVRQISDNVEIEVDKKDIEILKGAAQEADRRLAVLGKTFFDIMAVPAVKTARENAEKATDAFQTIKQSIVIKAGIKNEELRNWTLDIDRGVLRSKVEKP